MEVKERYYVDGIEVTDCKYFKNFYCNSQWHKKKICKNQKCGYKKKMTSQNDR